jgi:hypothetical protein
MKPKRLQRAAVLAVDLAADLANRLPGCCAVPPAGLVPVVWPLAVRLERLERKAAKGRKQAKAYRRAVRQARREVEQMLATQDGRLASVPDLLRTVPLDAGMWRLSLTPGAPAGLEAESEAA